MMFEQRRYRTTRASAIGQLELIYHSVVRDIRKGSGHALLGLLTNILQTVIFVGVFYVMMTLTPLRTIAVRGDFLLYIMSGVSMYLLHIKTIGAVAGALPATSAMMQHAPMNTIVAIASSAISALYIQVLSMVVVLYIYHAAFVPITIDDPVGAIGMVLLAWFSGVAIGMLFRAATPWAPGFINLVKLLYIRANMIASGKMFLANTLPGFMLPFFTWNPLFHTIDQTRGFVFLNYNPHYSNIAYPFFLSLTLIMIGLMGEFYTRKHASMSWGAGR